MLRLTFALIALLWLSPLAAEPMVKVSSVKRLTHLLSQLEKSYGEPADFTTLRLQLHLEDVYISQGTTLLLNPNAMALTLGSAIDKGLNRSQIAQLLLRQFQKGKYSEN